MPSSYEGIVVRQLHLPLLALWVCTGGYTTKSDAWTVWRHTYDYLPGCTE